MRSALGFPALSSLSQLYQPARPKPIWTSHGQTLSGGAGRVVAMVNTEPSASGMSSSPGYVVATSAAVAPQVSRRGRTHNAYSTGTAHAAAARAITAAATLAPWCAAPPLVLMADSNRRETYSRYRSVTAGLGAKQARIPEGSAPTNAPPPASDRMGPKAPSLTATGPSLERPGRGTSDVSARLAREPYTNTRRCAVPAHHPADPGP